ncbi:hypothetical protein MMC21_008017 [Puttea exsequens]|nr:hypothetical protein [Puttea exsequens]
MDFCDPDSGTTHGASLTGKLCDINSYSKVDEPFFAGLYPSFCSAVAAGGGKKALSKTLTSSDYHPVGKRSGSLSPRTPPVNPNIYKFYNFDFVWTGSADSAMECYKDCNEAFNAITAAPCGLSGMTYTASENVGCGTYSYTIDADLRVCNIDPSVTYQPDMVSWNTDNANQAIKDFCAGDFVVDPNTTTPPNNFSQGAGSGRDTYPLQVYRYPDGSTDHVTSIFVTFASTPNPGCSAPSTFNVKDYTAQCERLLGKVLADPDPCPGNTGGFVVEQAADHGCVDWQIFQWSISG